jgi:cytochrome P450
MRRRAQRDYCLNGFDIPKGTTIDISIWAIHRDPKNYPDPNSFVPDRWDPESGFS